VLVAFALLPVAAASANAGVLPATAHPYGHTYSQWAAAWWQWALGQPAPSNPVLDSTGAFCGQGQTGQVWFLAGTFGGPAVTRSCTVPAGKALLLPVLNDAYFAFPTDPPSQRTEAYVRSQVTAVATTSAPFATIDGVAVPNIPDYLEKSTLFRVVLPADNLFGLDAGFVLEPCADEGYYLVLSPLTPGHHTIHFGGAYNSTSVDVTYDLTVQPS
jgi:hypothetical protein